jgi:signal transduction histidine kinase
VSLIRPGDLVVQRSERNHPSHLDRWGWWLWSVTFLVIVALTIAVQLLEGRLPLSDGRIAGASLAGLVFAFCLLIGVKQFQLNRLRRVVGKEQMELKDMGTRLSEISEMFRVSTSLNLQLPLDAVLEIIVRRVVSTLGAQQASVMIYDPESGVLETRASYGLESEFARYAKRRIGEGIAGWVAEHKQAVLLGPDDGGPLGQHYKPNRNITSALSLPIRVGDRLIGVLNVNRINHPESFREHHRDILRMFAEHVGSVVERAEVVERLSARTRVLEASNFQLSELNRFKDHFLSTASHELRTPLTSVIGYAEVLEENEGKLSAPQRREFLRRMSSEAGALLGLIDDILDLTRLETGKLVLQKRAHALDGVARGALDTVRPLADKREVKLVATIDERMSEIALDEVKMKQVVVNLLANAIKFSPRGGVVELVTRSDGPFAVIEVKDQGPGIKPEEQASIFELFGQAPASGKEAPHGLGIGLHLVRRITELHEGRVGVEILPQGGSLFWIRLPSLHHEPVAPPTTEGPALPKAA